MKLTIQTPILKHAAAALANVAASATTLPVLRNVLIEATPDGRAKFRASDLDAYGSVDVACEVERPGRVTVPAALLSSIVRDADLPDIRLEALKTKLNLTAGTDKFSLATMPADDFPEWPDFKPSHSFSVEQPALRVALQSCLLAAPTKDPRKVLMGVLFDLRSDGLRLVGTDGKKMVVHRLPVLDCAPEVGETDALLRIVPIRMAQEIARHLGDDGRCIVRFAESQVAFELGPVRYVASVIEGQFPRYEMIIRKQHASVAVVDGDALAASIRRALLMLTGKDENSVKVSFDATACRVEAAGATSGKFTTELPVKSMTGDPIGVCLNGSFALELLRSAGGGELHVRMQNPNVPIFFAPDGEDTPVLLLMPIKLSEYERPDADDDAEAEPVAVGAGEESDAAESD